MQGALSLELAVRLAGLGHVLLFLASPAIPVVLGWRGELAGRVRPLTRQVFWTWAMYVWVTHLCFGLISLFEAPLLLESGLLGGFVCAFIATWWSARIVVQFTYFDRSAAPAGAIYRVGEAALVLLFVVLTATYWTAAVTVFRRA